MTQKNQRDSVAVRLLTAAGESFTTGDTVQVTWAGGAFAVNGGNVHTIEESSTVVTLFATTPPASTQQRDVITYQISLDDWQRCMALSGERDDGRPQEFRVDAD